MDAGLAVPVDLLAPPTTSASASAAAYGASRAKIHKTAQDFEASFLQTAMATMLDGESQQASAFGGGEAEGQFRSFLTEAMAKGVVKRGGIGLAPVIERELLKLQQAHPA